MGVPVVTLAGDRHAGRMGASILNAVGLGELVTTTPGQYAAVAARLAADPGSLQALRAGLRGRLQASCIMDEAGFTQRLEQAYAQIWEEHLRSRSAAAQSDAGLAGERLQRARALRAAGQLTEASDLCEAILRVEPAQPEALELRWDLAFDCGLPGIATDWLIRALAVRDAGKFHYMLGCVQQAQGQYQDATASFQRTLALEPGNARAHNNLGCLAEAGGQLPEAQAHYRMATEADPQLAPALYNLGNLHRQLAEPGAAIDIMRRALAIDGKHADWHCNLGALLLVRSELDAAADELRAAVAIDPGLVRAQQLLAALHWRCGRVAAALASLDTALRASEQADIASARLRILAWRDADQPGVLQAAHRQWSERHAHGVTRHGGSAGAGMRAPGARMTIGYLVPEESAHSLASHLLPLVAHHDRHRVDVIVYACGTLEEQLAADLRPHLRACRQLASLNDAEAARRMRADEVDVLVNLAGHDATGRMLLLASRPAPVQLPDLAGTMQPVGNECPLQLPGAGLCYAPHGDLANVALDGQRLAGPTVFGSVAPLAFASTQTLQLWAAALQAAPQARLLVVADGLQSQQCQDELLQRLGEQGIARERVTLRAPPQRRAAAFDGIDILLDSAPVNAVTAACDALWLGTPVLTLAGSVPAAQRVASLLRAAGQPQWVADSVGDFAAKAAQLAGSASQLRAQRSALRSSLGASTVMDAASCARQFESACRQLLAAAALPPEPAAAGVN
jgi:predicted O-linked N-acetylglucosamine transferase (SPINDLY family)